MPEVSRFFGIVIRMYYNDHNPPHFHAVYGSVEAVVAIGRAEILMGELPKRAVAMVVEWSDAHRDELLENWRRLRDGRPPLPVPPLA